MNPLPRETLAELVQTYGPELLDDARRVRALLYDTCPGDRREVGVLVAAVEEGIPLSISRASDSISVPGELDRLTTELEDTRGLSYDAARWAVRSWAWVLGMADPPVDQEGGATREPPSEPSTPPPAPPLPPATPAPPTAPLPRRADADAVTRRLPPSPRGPGGSSRRRPRRPLVLAAIAAVLLVPAVLVPVAVATSRRKPPPPATTLNGPTTAPTASPTRPRPTTSTTTTSTTTTSTTTTTTTPPGPVRFGEVTTTPSGNTTTLDVAPSDRRALTAVFSDRVVQVGPGATEPATRSFAMTLPLTDGAKGETLRIYIQGYAFVQESEGAYAQLTLKLNGQGTVRTYRSGWDDSFIEVLEVPATPATTYRLEGVVEVHRNPGTDGYATMDVLSIDASIKR
jgi:hypothetical protein